LVDDGSQDDGLQKAITKTEMLPQLKVVELSRNFGHHNALREGLAHATGDLIFMLDSDLEEEPEWFPVFLEQLNTNTDAVVGVQSNRKGGFLERINGAIFWKLFNFLTDVKIPNNICTIRLMKKEVAQAILKYQESEFFFSGVQSLAGFRQVNLTIEKKSKGYSSYTLKRRLALMMNAISSFSSKPLIYLISLGSIVSLISIVSGLVLLFRKFALHADFQMGWSSLILSIWFLSGVIMSMTGILGIYVAKMYNEVKQRPNTIVRNIYNKKS
jgi:putative glycosyltransferase